MRLTLEQYDRNVGSHLAAIRHHAEAIIRHVRDMTHQPDFEAQAEDDMARCVDVLDQAHRRAQQALGEYREKPHDAEADLK